MPVGSSSAPRSGTAEPAGRPADPSPLDGGAAIGDGAFRFVVAFAAVSLLVAIAVGGFGALTSRPGAAAASHGTPSAPAAATATPGPFLYATARSAPPIDLIDMAERPVSLSADRGSVVLVFFGYTHCPDVCPATIGIVGKVLADLGGGRALFVSIDPERDTPSWLREYAPYLPTGFTALTGSPAAIRTTADAWNVRYARVETGQADAYSMSHTADVFIVDAAGRLRGAFPFGTAEATMVATLRAMPELPAGPAGTSPSPSSGLTPSPTPTPVPSPTVASSTQVVGALRPTVVSSSIWAGGRSPLILALDGPAGRLDDPALAVDVTFVGSDGTALGPPVRAVAVRPPLEDRTLYVATLDVSTAGSWQLEVSATGGASGTLRGTVAITVLDPGSTAALGRSAPTSGTPTLDDVGGDHWAVSTDPAPDLRLYGTSTATALAGHQPFVLVVDSVRFRVSPACGKAVVLARYLLDRWPSTAFIHLEPYRYQVVSETPVVDGDLSNPTLTDAAAAWGFGAQPWGARSMPWVFVVDGAGIVRAKYEGVVGSDDVDVILALIAQGG